MEKTYEVYGSRKSTDWYYQLASDIVAKNDREALVKFEKQHGPHAIVFLCAQVSTSLSEWDASVWVLKPTKSYTLVTRIHAANKEQLLRQLTGQDPMVYINLANHVKPKPQTREQQLENEIQYLRQQIAQKPAAVAAATTSAMPSAVSANLKGRIAELEADRNKYSNDLKSAQAKIVEYNLLLSNLSTRADTVVSSQKEIARLKQEISEYQKQIGKDTATQVALRGDVIKTSEAVTLIRQEKDRLQSEKQRIQSEKERFQMAYQQEKKQRESDQMAYQQEKKQRESEKGQREDTNLLILTDLQKKEAQIEALKSDNRKCVESLQTQGSECQQDFDKLSALETEFENQKVAWDAERNQYIAAIELLKRRNEELKTAEINAKAMTVKAKEKSVSQATASLARLVAQQKQLKENAQKQEKLFVDARNEIETVKAERDRAFTSCQTNEESVRAFQQSNAQTQVQNKNLQLQLLSLQKQLKELKTKYNLQETTIRELLDKDMQQKHNLETSRNQEKARQQMLANQKQVLLTQNQEVKALRQQNDERTFQITTLQKQIADQTTAFEHLKALNQEYIEDQKFLTKTVASQKQVIAQQKRDLEQLHQYRAEQEKQKENT